jgi:hypothetical protein
VDAVCEKWVAEGDTDMTISVYSKTATKAKSGKVYAFGRRDDLSGKDTSLGGYVVFRLCENYNGQVRGGMQKSWRYVDQDLSFQDAVNLMNKKCGYTAFNA